MKIQLKILILIKEGNIILETYYDADGKLVDRTSEDDKLS